MIHGVQELKSLGRYQIRGVLGKGAMGLVYDAHDPKLDRRVAIKTILTRQLDEATARHYSIRFQREVRAVARLNHPNIVQVYDFGNEADLAYIVMEYIHGRELKDYFDAKERFDLRTILRLMTELLSALDCAHEAGVIHRDVKPANIMVDANGHAKLTDFGVARFTEPGGEAEATRAGAMIGTLSYMSPSRSRGSRSTGARITSRPASSSTSSSPERSRSKARNGNWPKKRPGRPGVAFHARANLARHRPHRRSRARQAARAPLPERPQLRRVAPASRARQADRRHDPVPGAGPSQRGGDRVLERVKDSDDPEKLALYIEQFPHGVFVEQARRRVAELRGKKS